MAAGQLTLYGARALLGVAFGQAFTPPLSWFFALCTTTPATNASGADIAALEPSSVGTNYSRLEIPNSSTYWNNSGATYISNNTDMSWPMTPVVGATSDWPVCRGWALLDALTGGNCWMVGTCAVQVATPAGYCAYLGQGTLFYELSPFFQVQSNG